MVLIAMPPAFITAKNAAAIAAPLKPRSSTRLPGCMPRSRTSTPDGVGSSRLGAFMRILLPLAAPGLVATSVFVFVTTWNEYIFANVLLIDQSDQTVTVWLSYFYGSSRNTDWGGLMAASTLTAIPVVIFFMLVQRRIAFGLTSGAVRG